MRAQFKEIDARPAKKVAEAKARKTMRAQFKEIDDRPAHQEATQSRADEQNTKQSRHSRTKKQKVTVAVNPLVASLKTAR